MGIFDDIVGVLQKPQSIATGALQGFLNQSLGLGPTKATREQRGVNRMLDDLEAAGVDTSQWSGLRAADNDTSTVFSGIMSGAKGNIRPSDALVSQAGGDPLENRGPGGEASSIGIDLLADPLLALGPAAKVGKLGKLAEGAATVGKAEDLSRGQKVAQLGRQLYQGTMATGDPLTGLGAGLLGRQVENAAVKWGPAIGRRLGKGAVEATTETPSSGILPEPLALNAGPQPVSPRGPTTIPGFSDPIPGGPTGTTGMDLRQLGPGVGNVFEAGPVGSTGGLNPQAMQTLAGLQQGPPALPPAFGTSGGFPMGSSKDPADELLEILIKEARRLRGQ